MTSRFCSLLLSLFTNKSVYLAVYSDSREDDLKVQDRVIIDERADSNNYFLASDARKFDRQYFPMYQHRLSVLKERVKSECIRRWDDDFRLNGKPVVMRPKVLDIQGNKPCWVIGSVYCEMKYKPNILEEVVNDVYGAPDLTKSYTDPDGSDELMLEDESGRVLLVGDFIRSTPFVTGAVIGILGMEADAGTFQVLDICYPTPVPQKPLSERIHNPSGSSKKLILISGLNIGITSPNRLLKLQMLQEFLMGRICSRDKSLSIGKLIICGNSISHGQNETGELINCLEELGKFLGNILQSIPVALMPGENDPSDKALPQQPLHKALFQQPLRNYFHENNRHILDLTTNPSRYDIEGIDLLATSGQNIDDICKYVIPYQKQDELPVPNDTIEHRLDLMECTLRWQNIAPTAPDTLWTYPFQDSDPFIIDQLPHVYVVGNQPTFGYRDLDLDGTNIKIISIPEFSSSGEVVILDLTTLEPEIVKFEI